MNNIFSFIFAFFRQGRITIATSKSPVATEKMRWSCNGLFSILLSGVRLEGKRVYIFNDDARCGVGKKSSLFEVVRAAALADEGIYSIMASN